VASRIDVPFRGEGSGVAELTWGQQSVWRNMRRTGLTMNIGGVVPLVAGESLPQMVQMLQYLIGRHEALRTRLRFVPGAEPVQVVHDAGVVPLEIVDVDPGDDADAAAARMRDRYDASPFDYAGEWPLRMGVVRSSGALTHLVVFYCHLAVDGLAIAVLVRDLDNLASVTGGAAVPVSGWTPLQLAAQQQSPAGSRMNQKALRYWERLVSDIPVQRFGVSDDPRAPRYWNLRRRSPALDLAIRSIAHRTGCGFSFVFLAVYAVALARCTGRNPSVAQLLVSNRFRPGHAESVSQLAQLGLCVLDVADTTFDEVVDRAWKAGTSAYLHGYYDPIALDGVLARVREHRGDVDISCIVNDRRELNGPRAPAAPPAPGQLQAALPLSTSWWHRKTDAFDASLNVSIDAAPDALIFSVCADTYRMAPAQIEALADQIEAVAVESAFDNDVPTRVSATANGALPAPIGSDPRPFSPPAMRP
jgi:hypothetical protein